MDIYFYIYVGCNIGRDNMQYIYHTMNTCDILQHIQQFNLSSKDIYICIYIMNN